MFAKARHFIQPCAFTVSELKGRKKSIQEYEILRKNYHDRRENRVIKEYLYGQSNERTATTHIKCKLFLLHLVFGFSVTTQKVYKVLYISFYFLSLKIWGGLLFCILNFHFEIPPHSVLFPQLYLYFYSQNNNKELINKKNCQQK